MNDAAKIRELLARALSELNPANEWPVNLDRILSRLGLEVTFREESSKRKGAYLQLGERPSIIIHRDGGNTTQLPSERFSIAHELAHWVIWRRFSCLPSSHNEYWQHEALANEFAAQLLVAPQRLDEFLAEQRAKQVHPVHFPRKMADKAAVSWKVAARILSSTPSADAAYLRLTRRVSAGGRSNQNSGYLWIECSSLSSQPGSFVGQSARLRETDLFEWLTSLDSGTLQNKTVTLKAGNLELTNVPCTFKRSYESWVVHFQRSHDGVRIGKLSELSGKANQSTGLK